MLLPITIFLSSVNILFKHRICVKSFELGLEAIEGVTVGTAVGATTSIGEIVAIILGLVARGSPETETSA